MPVLNSFLLSNSVSNRFSLHLRSRQPGECRWPALVQPTLPTSPGRLASSKLRSRIVRSRINSGRNRFARIPEESFAFFVCERHPSNHCILCKQWFKEQRRHNRAEATILFYVLLPPLSFTQFYLFSHMLISSPPAHTDAPNDPSAPLAPPQLRHRQHNRVRRRCRGHRQLLLLNPAPSPHPSRRDDGRRPQMRGGPAAMRRPPLPPAAAAPHRSINARPIRPPPAQASGSRTPRPGPPQAGAAGRTGSPPREALGRAGTVGR